MARVRSSPEQERRKLESAAARRPAAPPGALTAEALLALQPSAGNAALARLVTVGTGRPVLARTKAEHVDKLKELRTNLQILEDTVAAMLAKEKEFNSIYEGTRYVRLDIAPLEKHIADAKPLLADVEAEKDPDTALKQATRTILAGGREKVRLEDLYGKEEVRGARTKVTAERIEREERERKASEKAASAEARKREEEDQRTRAAEAEARRQTEMASLGFTPNADGPAYTRPSTAGGRRALLRYVQLRHPSFASMTESEIHPYACFVYHLTLAQIERVERFLEGRRVTAWSQQGVPASRSQSGLRTPLVMPLKVSGLAPEIGAEIFVDWVIENPGHSSPISRIADSFSFTARPEFAVTCGTVERRDGKIAYRYTSTGKRLVTNESRTAIITYYDGR